MEPPSAAEVMADIQRPNMGRWNALHIARLESLKCFDGSGRGSLDGSIVLSPHDWRSRDLNHHTLCDMEG